MGMHITDIIVYSAFVLAAIGCYWVLSTLFSVNRTLSFFLCIPLGMVIVGGILYIVYRSQK